MQLHQTQKGRHQNHNRHLLVNAVAINRDLPGHSPFFTCIRSRGLSSPGPSLLWDDAAQGHVGTIMIAFPHPLGGIQLDPGRFYQQYGDKHSYRKVRLHRSTYGFCCWAWLDVVQLDPYAFGSILNLQTDVLRPLSLRITFGLMRRLSWSFRNIR